jgi:hypothetical protein
MAKLTRHYTIPNDLLALYEGLPVSRSAGMSLAITEALKAPHRLAKALQKRVGHNLKEGIPSVLGGATGNSTAESTTVTVTLDQQVLDAAAQLEKLTGLPREIVIRLSMEAYVHKL